MLRELGHTRLRALQLSFLSLAEYKRYLSDSGLRLMLYREHRDPMDVFSECYFGKNYLNKPISCIIDIGAHTGRYAWACYKLLKPRNMHLYEPNPDLAPQLDKLALKMPESVVHVRNVAVGAERTEIGFRKVENPLLNSPLEFNEPNKGILKSYDSPQIQKISVHQVTLDDEFKDIDEIDFLKIDTQGYEMSVLKGARATLAKTRVILIESNFLSIYAGGSTFGQAHEFLTEVGFLLVQLDAPSRSSGVCVWTDALYVAKKLV